MVVLPIAIAMVAVSTTANTKPSANAPMTVENTPGAASLSGQREGAEY